MDPGYGVRLRLPPFRDDAVMGAFDLEMRFATGDFRL
jgi:hypothetical protein